MTIYAHIKNYELNIEKDFSFIKNIFSEQAYYVIDRKIWNLYMGMLKEIPCERLFLLDAFETNKTIETALEICEKMTALSSKRNTILVSFGGGIVQDVTGFVANVLYRGIKWIFVPTTLLASCDSCIGGKTSLNYKSYKNLLGTFYPPDLIYVCPAFFRTLSERDYMSGLGEVLKFNIMAGKSGLMHIQENLKRILARDEKTIDKFVETSLLFKKDFIEEDEFDKGRRILLNFAHTFGHALEVTSKYEVPHGTAVAIGMLVANRISLQRGLLGKSYVEEIENVVLQIIRIPLDKNWFNVSDIVSIIKKDKKQTGTALTCILIDNDLTLSIHKDLTVRELKNAFDHIVNLLDLMGGGYNSRIFNIQHSHAIAAKAAA